MALSRTNRIKLAVFVLLMVFCFILGRIPGVHERLTLEWVGAQAKYLSEIANRPWGPILFAGISVALILLHMPGLIMVAAGALVYPLWEAFALAWAASNIGTIATFLIARFFLHDVFSQRLERSFLKPLASRLETQGVRMMFVLRSALIMMPPLNWLLGVTRIRTGEYIIGNMLGLAPIIFIVQWTVKRLQTIRSIWDLFRWEVIVIMLGLPAAVVAAAALRSRLIKRTDGGQAKP